MSKNKDAEIELIARGVMVQGGMLLACRNRRRGNLYLPGGHIDFGESACAALVREVREEMGLRSRAGRFLGVCEFTYERKKRQTCEINLIFELRIPGVKPSDRVASCEKKLAFEWVPLKDLKQSKLLPDILRPWLGCRLKQRHVPEMWLDNYEKWKP